jgi:hypothetical protein
VSVTSSLILTTTQRRRERGRLAQSAFRKRQAQAKQGKDAEIARLRGAIEAIVNEACAADRPELRAKIDEAAALLTARTEDQEEDNHTSETNLTESSPGTSPDGSGPVFPESSDNVSGYTAVDEAGLAGAVSLYNRTTLGTKSTKLLDPNPGSGWKTPATEPENRPESVHHWHDPFYSQRCVSGAATVLPYVGAGAFTIAGRIFWHLIDYLDASTAMSVDVLAAAATGPDKHRNRTGLQELINRSGTMMHFNPAEWSAAINSRMETYTRHGLVEVQDPKVREWTPGTWLSPMMAEQRIRSVVGDDVFSLLATPLLSRWEAAKSKRGNIRAPSDYTEVVDTFLRILPSRYVCFGDGPRWRLQEFDEALRDWCVSVTAYTG